MDEFAYQITPENKHYIKSITGLTLALLEANLSWIVYRNANTYYQWHMMPAASFRATYPDTTIEIP